MKLQADVKGLQDGMKKAEDSVKGFGKVASAQGSLVTGIFQGLGQGIARGLSDLPQILGDLANRGRDFNELAGAFKALGNTDADLNRLRVATQGLVADTDLFKSANMAEQLGITQEAFGKLAESADALGDAVGVGTVQSLELLTRALGTGQEKALKSLGITIDSEKAERDFAKSIGTTADKLNEKGKLAAFQAAALAKISEKTKTLSGDTISSADAFDRASNAAKNFIDRLSTLLDTNPKVAETFRKISVAIDQLSDSFLGTDNIGGQAATYFNKQIVDSIAPNEAALRAAMDKSRQKAIDILKEAQANPGASEQDKQNAVTQSKYFIQQADLIKDKLANLKPVLQGNKNDFIDVAKGAADAGKKFEDFTNKINADKLGSEAKKIGDSFDRIFDSISGSTAGNFQGNLAGGATQFNKLREDLKKNVYEGYLAGLDKADRDRPEALAEATRKAGEAVAVIDEKLGETVGKTAVKFGEDMKDQIQRAADFGTDALYNMFTGAAFDFEDAMKRVLAGIGGGILGNLFPGLGNFSNLQELGQNIGGQIIQGALGNATGGAGGILSSLFGVGAGAAAGQYGVTGGLIGPAQASAGLGIAGLGIGAAAAGTAYFVFNTTNDNFSGKNAGVDKGEAAGFAAIDSIFPGVGSGLSKIFGGGVGKGKRERLAREGFIDSLGDRASFQGVRGQIDLSATGYNFGDGKGRTQFSDKAVGLTSGLSGALGGDSAKLREDLNNIFADAVDDGKSFAEVLINAQALMQALGVDAGQAKDEITQAFLQGKITLEEYNSQFDSLNQLMSTNIEGTGNVDAAIKVLGDSTTTTAAKIQATALAFNEMKEVGIDTSKETAAYLTDRYGPEIAKVFADLAAAGIDTFEEVKGASSDSLHTIINAVQGINFSDTMINEQAKAESYVVASNQRMADSYNKVRDAARGALEGTDLYNANGKLKSGNAAKINENPANTEFVP